MKKIILILMAVICMLGCSTEKQIVKEYVTVYECNVKDRDYATVMAFLEEDKTEDMEYDTDRNACVEYAIKLRDNANSKGIRCGLVIINMVDRDGHAINVFKTEKGLIYIEPQLGLVVLEPSVGGAYFKDEDEYVYMHYGILIGEVDTQYINARVLSISVVW
jgi:hypothetical protein